MRRRPLFNALFPLLAAVAGHALAAEGEAGSLLGLPLDEAIKALQDAGLTVYYSSDVVRPSMRVQSEPAATEPRDKLEEILAPFELGVAPGPGDSLLIVRAPPRPPRVPPRRAEPLPDEPVSQEASRPKIDEVIVAASRYELTRNTVASATALTSADIDSVPTLGDDALRAVQRLPGTTSDGFSARTNVRGGEVGETLVRFDALRLYDPFHLENFQGVFSTIDPRVVSSMSVYTGGFPALYGDRMSGVIDVASLDPPAHRYHEVGVSFFNTSLLSAGKFDDERGEWVVSLRRSNLDVLYGEFSDRPERPRYVDGYARVARRFGEHTRVSLNTLYFNDRIELHDDVDVEEIAKSRDEDRYVWIRLDQEASNGRLHGATLLSHTELGTDRSGTSEKSGILSGSLLDEREFRLESLQSDWTWSGTERWHAQFGGSATRSRGRYDYADEVQYELLFDTPGAPTEADRTRSVSLAPSGNQYALYGSVRFDPLPRVSAELGLRWDRSTLRAVTDDDFGPRLGVRYQWRPKTYVRASVGRFFQSQTINELQVGDGVSEFFAPQRSDHVVVGLDHSFPNGLDLRLEAYSKRLRDLRPRFENVSLSLTLLPEIRQDRVAIVPTRGTARGLETRLEGHPREALDWWLAYSLSSASDEIEGRTVERSWDQRHALFAGLNWRRGPWSLAAALQYRSGWPITPVLGFDDALEVPIVQTAPRNSARGPSFRSVDLRVERKARLPRSDFTVFLEITNVFDRRNRCCTEYQLESEDVDQPFLELTPVNYLGIVPSIGFVWSLGR